MVVSHQHQARMTQRLKSFLEELARENLPFGANLDIDGVVCLANSNDLTQQVVLKVHHKTTQSHGFTETKPPVPFQDTIHVPVDWMNNNNNDMPQDLSIKETPAAKVSKGMSLLNHTTVKASNKSQQPAPLQLVNKTPQQLNVATLLYQRIMDKPSNQQQQPVQLIEAQSVKAEASKKQAENSEEADPSLTKGEMLCKLCSQTIYGGFVALQTHTWNKHERFLCKVCYQSFTLRCNLRRHERLHDGLKPFKCDICEKSFSRGTDLKMHMQKHSDSGSLENKAKMTSCSPIICPRCSKTFEGVEAMRFHMYKLHKSQDDAWVCTICEQLFLDQETYDEHRETHTASLQQYKRRRIDTDEENTNDDQVMRDEYQRELQAIDDDDACKIGFSSDQDESSNESRAQNYPSITKALTTKSPATNSSRNKRKGNPIKHVQTTAESEDESFFEPVSYSPMDVETVNPESTTSPVPSVESENDPLQNSYNSDILASSSFSQFSRGTGDFELPTDHLQSLQTLSQLRSPLVIKPDNNLSPMSLPRSSDVLYSNSPLCHSPALSVYSNNTTLDDSTTPDRSLNQTPQPVDDADDDKEYQCSYDQCTELCFGFKAYETHTVSIHSRYPCKLCKQTFSGKNNRTRHMRNHNRAKIYPCPDCGKYFSRPDSMREHRFIHTASYQEDKCRRCHQVFTRKSLLLAHLKVCFRQSRTKNGSIDESPYMFANSTPSVRPGEEDTSSNSMLADPTRVKLENNNEAILPSALQLALMKKDAAIVPDSNVTEETALDLANPMPNNNTEEKALDLVTSSDKPVESNTANVITPELARQVAQQVAEKVTQQIVTVETPQIGTV